MTTGEHWWPRLKLMSVIDGDACACVCLAISADARHTPCLISAVKMPCFNAVMWSYGSPVFLVHFLVCHFLRHLFQTCGVISTVSAKKCPALAACRCRLHAKLSDCVICICGCCVWVLNRLTCITSTMALIQIVAVWCSSQLLCLEFANSFASTWTVDAFVMYSSCAVINNYIYDVFWFW